MIKSLLLIVMLGSAADAREAIVIGSGVDDKGFRWSTGYTDEYSTCGDVLEKLNKDFENFQIEYTYNYRTYDQGFVVYYTDNGGLTLWMCHHNSF